MLRVTADTNIFISALNFKGKPFDLLSLARNRTIELAISDPIMAEIKRVLRVKFQWPHEDIAAIERHIASFTRHVEPQRVVELVKDDPADNRVLECAAAARSDCIVSGDNHLLKLERFGRARILKVADFLDELGKEVRQLES